MKQFFTLENELMNIADLLSEMVENQYISSVKAEEIIEKLTKVNQTNDDLSAPGSNVVNRIMNYSKSIDTLKSNNAIYNVLGN